jgi:hypothetical protein
MSGHPGVMDVTTGPSGPAGVGPRELGPGPGDAARGTGDPSPAGSDGPHESHSGVARCQ